MPTIKRIKEKVIVTPEMIKPTDPALEIVGVFNPSASEFGNEIFLLARVAEGVIEKKRGWKSSPHYAWKDGKLQFQIEWFNIAKEKALDKKTNRYPSWAWRLPFLSHFRLIKLSKDGFTLNSIDDKPSFYPEFEFERYSIEDPRVTWINGKYYMTYVSVGPLTGVATALASTSDFKTFKRHGIIFPQANKDVVLFPEKIAGKYYILHRPMPQFGFAKPSIMLATSPDLEHWGHTDFLLGQGEEEWCSEKVGAGCPPIRTKEGWLLIYHGVNVRTRKGPAGTYSAGALLLDLMKPEKILARTKSPILIPEQPYETKGFVSHVIFPTGIIRRGDSILLYNGCADTVVSAIEVSLADIFNALK